MIRNAKLRTTNPVARMCCIPLGPCIRKISTYCAIATKAGFIALFGRSWLRPTYAQECV